MQLTNFEFCAGNFAHYDCVRALKTLYNCCECFTNLSVSTQSNRHIMYYSSLRPSSYQNSFIPLNPLLAFSKLTLLLNHRNLLSSSNLFIQTTLLFQLKWGDFVSVTKGLPILHSSNPFKKFQKLMNLPFFLKNAFDFISFLILGMIWYSECKRLAG